MSHSQVAVVRCEEYDAGKVTEKVRDALKLLGGVAQFAKPGDRVLLKPNLLNESAPEKAVTTHPFVVAAMAEILKEAGARLFLGDSPAIYPFLHLIRNTGMEELVRRYEIELVPFKTPGERAKESNYILKRVPIAKEAMEFDKIFNVCKLKTHLLTHFTGAVKNMYGCVPGLTKSELHVRVSQPRLFAHVVLDIYDTITPVLSIMDGIVGMEGNGPNNGIPKKIGVILASTDAVALDATALRIVGQNPMKIPTIAFGTDRNIGKGEEADIDILGESVSSFRIADFKMPQIQQGLTRLPNRVNDWLRKNIVSTPQIKGAKCTLCRKCEKICPAHAISCSQTGKMQINLSACIRCFCCMEACSFHAIIAKPHSLNKAFRLVEKWVEEWYSVGK